MGDYINNSKKINQLENQLIQEGVKIYCLKNKIKIYKRNISVYKFLTIVQLILIFIVGVVRYDVIYIFTNNFNIIPQSSLYDVVIDCKSFGLIMDGWNLTYADTDFAKKFKNLEKNYESTVVVLGGGSNSDKRFILNELEQTNFNASFGYDNPLLAFYQSRLNPMVVYFNTMGWDRLKSQNNEENSERVNSVDTTYDSISDRLGNVFIDVVGKNQDTCNICTSNGINYYNEPKVGKTHLVIHNYRYAEKEEQIEKYILDDITNRYIGGKKKFSNITRECNFWSINGTYHFVMAKKGSEAAVKYNNCTINLIKQIVGDRGKHEVIHRKKVVSINLLGEIIDLTSKKMTDILKKCIDTSSLQIGNYHNSIKWHHNNKDSPKYIVTDNKIKMYRFYSNVHENEFDYNAKFFGFENSFSISINTSDSNVYWVCHKEFKNKIYAVIEKQPPKSVDELDDVYSTFGLVLKGFDLPVNFSIDCETMIKNAIHKDDISFIEIHDGSFTTNGSPKLLDDKYY